MQDVATLPTSQELAYFAYVYMNTCLLIIAEHWISFDSVM